ncbi:MAG: phytanoyl-CoA dioxygenase family protein [Acidimicrobiales bacterium]
MTIDQRTRRDGEVPVVDAPTFLDETLPGLARSRSALVALASGLDLRPMTVEVDDRSWTLTRPQPDVIGIESGGNPAKLRLRLTPDQLASLVNDQVTPIGLMTAGTLDLVGGGIGRFLDWWLLWRSLLDDVPVYVPGTVDLPVDLHRSFSIDDDPAEIRSFLETAGYVHLRGVFTEEEMAQVSADMDAAEPTYRPDDGDSWWATLDDGTERVVRMQHFERQSPTVASILDDPRFLRIAEIADCGHTVDWATDNRVEALFKPLGVVNGISDVPWHKDCSLGRHSYECSALTVGISVTGGGPTSGQLRVIAGSHRARVWPSLLDTTTLDLPDVPLPTETGDVTVHLSCTLHMAQPPTDTERRVLYTGFRLPSHDDGAARAASRRLLKASREGAPRNTSQAAAR